MVFLPEDYKYYIVFLKPKQIGSLSECQQVIMILIEAGLQYLLLMVEFITWSQKLDGNEGIKCNEYLCGFLLPLWSGVPGEKCSCNW